MAEPVLRIENLSRRFGAPPARDPSPGPYIGVWGWGDPGAVAAVDMFGEFHSWKIRRLSTMFVDE